MKIFRYWGPVIIWMIIIFAFSSRHSVRVADTDTVNFLFFKTLHVLEYFILYLLILRARTHTSMQSTRRVYLFTFFLTILYAISDEIHQTFVPTREGRPRDVIIDAIGALLAWVMIWKLLPRWPKKLRKLVNKWHLLS